MTSEQTFQAQKTAMVRAFEASPNLGLAPACNHEGLVITGVPQGVEWLGRYGHGATGRLLVNVYEDGVSTPILETEVAAAVMGIVNAAVPAGAVYDRVVVATNDAEFERFYTETGVGGTANIWIVQQTSAEPIRGGGIDSELVGVAYVFEFFYWRRDLREAA